ncbi:MAG: hypothetical protein JSU82_18530 [Rhodospirillales bacterium]|nr:MAG: hypothetical protein JSU82_18530 [Rhodospirillales bacterium]
MTSVPDLPRWGIVLQAWRLLIEQSGRALRSAVLPFLLLMALHRLGDIVAPEGFQLIGWGLLTVVLFPVPAALLLVPWYRTILSAKWPELAGRPAQWWYVSFMLRTLGLELMLLVFQIPSAVAGVMAMEGGGAPDPQLTGLGSLLFLAALMPGFYLYGRAALALPAAAGQGDDSYGRSWRTTAGAGWRIAGIVFLIWFPFFLLNGMVSVPAGASPGLLSAATGAAIDIFRELAMAAALALVYLHYGTGRETSVWPTASP